MSCSIMKRAERIKEAIKNAGGYDLIGEMTGIARSTLFAYTSNRTEPPISKIELIAKATGTSPIFLAFGETSDIGDAEELSLLNGIMNLNEENRAIISKILESMLITQDIKSRFREQKVS